MAVIDTVGVVQPAMLTVAALGEPTVYPDPPQQPPGDSVTVTLCEPLNESPNGVTAILALPALAATVTVPPRDW